eukprot:8108911-Alexandrium_andersonii.AAC.1
MASKSAPRSSRRVDSAPLFVEIPNPPTQAGLEGSEVAKSQGSDLQSAIRPSAIRAILCH